MTVPLLATSHSYEALISSYYALVRRVRYTKNFQLAKISSSQLIYAMYIRNVTIL